MPPPERRSVLPQALARLPMREHLHVGPHRLVVEARQDRVGARTDLLRRARALELVSQLRQQVRSSGIGARSDRSESRRAWSRPDSRTRASIASRIGRTCSSARPAGSGMSHASTVVGTYGQTSPQPIVTAQSACSCISRTSLRGLRSLRSNPTSAIASTTVGHSARAGVEPADSARTSSGAYRSKNACAICDRPAL